MLIKLVGCCTHSVDLCCPLLLVLRACALCCSLFEHVDSWQVFATAQIVHVVLPNLVATNPFDRFRSLTLWFVVRAQLQEVFLYSFRMTPTYFRLWHRFRI